MSTNNGIIKPACCGYAGFELLMSKFAEDMNMPSVLGMRLQGS